MSFLTSKTITLGAAGSVTAVARLFVTGRFWFCTAATGEFWIGKGRDGELAPFSLGLGYELPAVESDFNQLEIQNRTASAVTVTIMFGTGKLTDSRLNVLTTQLLNTLTKEGVTALVANSGNIAAAGSVTFTGAGGGYTQRKRIIFFNMDGAATLDILVGATIGGAVQPLQAITIDTSGALVLKNNTGGIVAYRSLEVFYT